MNPDLAIRWLLIALIATFSVMLASGWPEAENAVGDASDFITAIAAVFAVLVAFRGLSVWKSQHSANADFQIAQAAYTALVMHESLINDVRRWWTDANDYYDPVDDKKIGPGRRFDNDRKYRDARENFRRFKVFEAKFSSYRVNLRIAEERFFGSLRQQLEHISSLENTLKDNIIRGYPGISDDQQNHFIADADYPPIKVAVRDRRGPGSDDPFGDELRAAYVEAKQLLILKMEPNTP